MKTAIHIENLCVSYGSQCVLDSLSVDIPKNMFTAILGENGSGKSTLLNSICRLVAYNNGNIALNSINLASFSPRELALQVAGVSQSIEPLPVSVFDYLLLGRTPHRSLFSVSDSDEDKALVDNAITRLGLSAFQHKKLSQLSGGERQLVAIGRAIVQDTPIILLDEPTANLDIRHQEEIMRILCNEVRENGKTVVVVMHDINLAARYAQYVCLLQNGYIMASGSPDDVLTEANLSSLYGISLKKVEGTYLFYPT